MKFFKKYIRIFGTVLFPPVFDVFDASACFGQPGATIRERQRAHREWPVFFKQISLL